MTTPKLTDFNLTGRLTGRPIQAIHEESATQIYPVGTTYEKHGKVFKYCRANAAITVPNRGCPNMAYLPWHTNNIYGAKVLSIAAAQAGEKKVIVTFDDYITDTTPYNGICKDYFAGGEIVFFNINQSSTIIINCRVSGNEISTVNASSAANEDMILYLDEELPYDLVVADSVVADLHPNPYMNVGDSGSVGTYGSVVCVPPIPVTSGYWFWGQTYGPCWVTPNAGITTAAVRDVVFHTNGTIKVNSGDGLQRAGTLIDFGDGSQDDALILLQLSAV
jgi:hypothetical protein